MASAAVHPWWLESEQPPTGGIRLDSEVTDTSSSSVQEMRRQNAAVPETPGPGHSGG